jgi:uncharacterized protein YggE
MEKAVQITLIVVLAIIVLAGLGAFLFLQAKKQSSTISVDGLATIKAMPDLVAIYFRAETNGTTASEAREKNAEIVDKAIKSLIAIGIPEEKIQTLDFNIYADYDWIDGRQELRGYKAIHSFKVELSSEKMDKAGAAIDAAVDAGVLVEHIDFELSTEKQNEYKAIAMSQASQDARTKAEAIASGLGKKIGKVVTVSALDFGYYPWPIYRAETFNAKEAKAALTTIKPAEKEISARVSVTFEIS